MALPPAFMMDHEFGRRPRCIMDQFGMNMPHGEMMAVPMITRGLPALGHMVTGRDLGCNIINEKNKFQVVLDVQNFSPEDISVRVVDGDIVIECKHEEKKDSHGFITRQFMRRFSLPEECLPETVESKLSSDAVLMVTAPKQISPAVPGELIVNVVQTGPVRTEVRDYVNGDTAN